MAKTERVREAVSTSPSDQYFKTKMAAGWRLVSIEWERDVALAKLGGEDHAEETPYGLQVAGDCFLLQDNPQEKLALMRMLELISKDRSLSEVAGELNRGGYRTRQGSEWTPNAVFDMLPRLIEAGPRLMVDQEYVARKHKAATP